MTPAYVDSHLRIKHQCRRAEIHRPPQGCPSGCTCGPRPPAERPVLKYFAVLPNYGQAAGRKQGGSREVVGYLQFVIDFWENLPNVVIFSQDDRTQLRPAPWGNLDILRPQLREWKKLWGPDRPLSRRSCMCDYLRENSYRQGNYYWYKSMSAMQERLMATNLSARSRTVTWPRAATFAASRFQIRAQPLWAFEQIHRVATVERACGSVGTLTWAHSMERLWLELFDERVPKAFRPASPGDRGLGACFGATCNLNQWAMDFRGNLERIEASIREAKAAGCTFRTGPELEVTGYSCEDSFLEADTLAHAWESLAALLASDLTDGILCDIGMPVMHRNVSYNCRVVLLNRRVVGVRPKVCLANDGNYREMRYFTPWFIDPTSPGYGALEQYYLPRIVRELTGQRTVPIGIFAALDTALAFETCEALLPSGRAIPAGGVYLYANQKGCDGGRLYFDGCAMAWVNGECVAQGSPFEGLDEVEVVVATVSLSDVRAFRASFIARSSQAASAASIPRVEVDFALTLPYADQLCSAPSRPSPPRLHSAMEEIALGPSGWLWDYLRRSGQRGYFLPLSGGADSSSTAALVAIMCQRVVEELGAGSERSRSRVLADVRRVTKRADYTPPDWRDLCGKVLVTCYMASEFSGAETRARAALLAEQIGCLHTSISIDGMRSAARSRMVMAYFMAQLMPWATDGDETTAGGSLLVLGSANVDEALRGYYTKYDCSAADLNPIGGVNKRDLKAFLEWAGRERGIGVLARVADAPPSAELTGAEGAQLDEEDMGMSYDELAALGYCRKVERCGPLSTFLKLRDRWADGRALTPSIRARGAAAPVTFDEQVAQKVKDFYFYHAINRHKMTTLTPSYHAESYSPDDNRFDLRPFLQNARFDEQFKAIDEAVAAAKAARGES
ncbi:hypothetical protein EMIHUDRAFT_460331 [Emiliania huxleyi CCMP1516]|uniref:NAD(+) synthase [glutamine-hydrolyzing] n=2 Tax=Emiliania huxleyi TaxID=2903 RepID=A0A0D3KYG4_EMIH1|nr:hypothetical protein EMIHUDRAFT_460331 [Emiliania huxleyi CCMP1516]EOD40799.1 hypothetical protein EMIHUDRAFT_460331 [Emiliania huxleyi CCMP1516]|eukprot:XP_005793228.1 hypothetical protein EMIHUDRAFT_460331 [Emiliania huxleyi CCMP1516]